MWMRPGTEGATWAQGRQGRTKPTNRSPIANRNKRILPALDRRYAHTGLRVPRVPLAARQFPCLRVLPRNINGVIQVQKKPFAAIEEAEPQDVVVEKSSHRAHDNVAHTETALPLGHRQLRSQG